MREQGMSHSTATNFMPGAEIHHCSTMKDRQLLNQELEIDTRCSCTLSMDIVQCRTHTTSRSPGSFIEPRKGKLKATLIVYVEVRLRRMNRCGHH